jgi:hypothetical protein
VRQDTPQREEVPVARVRSHRAASVP